MPAQFGDFMKMNLLIVERIPKQSIWMRYFPFWRCWQFYWISIAFTVTFVSLESVTLSIVRQCNTGMIDHNCRNEMCVAFTLTGNWKLIKKCEFYLRFIFKNCPYAELSIAFNTMHAELLFMESIYRYICEQKCITEISDFRWHEFKSKKKYFRKIAKVNVVVFDVDHSIGGYLHLCWKFFKNTSRCVCRLNCTMTHLKCISCC